ncbi:hypothetical protein CWB99_09560 [Pseudoalteromonas rubra]|uniref:Putative heavy-metal chelation domain-containing protein n=1 Tax=Pseudoalteromonas rubra TaxID=43658 RepID=A0A5S3WNK2_9GAMM|nr:DUF364 domain-containing protein [Pseudoalteromonas rubra]TMP29007.1 hypothetical protein CWB99_09560 [Pseudoalteromonas rubra]TMP29193.1 hypothetical protein CWC00_19815 [Pseudoalteromonas rubra]
MQPEFSRIHDTLEQQRLNFKLPAFFRWAWVSDQARTLWAPKINAIRDLVPHVFAEAVLSGHYPCALLELTQKQADNLRLATQRHRQLTIIRLPPSTLNLFSNRPYWLCCLENDAEQFLTAWQQADLKSIYSLINAPQCCTNFNHDLEYLYQCQDPTYLSAAHALNSNEQLLNITFENAPLLNQTFKKLGVSTLSYAPCSPNCQHALVQAENWMALAGDMGYTSLLNDMLTLFGAPCAWTAMHGIAEIKTPLLKISTNTDATRDKFTVNYLSETDIEGAATGLGFPFKNNCKSAITQSKSFQRGMDNVIPSLDVTDVKETASPANDTGLKPLPYPDSKILDDTLERVLPGLAVHIKSIFLSNTFCVITLNNDNTGCCMNYFRFKSQEAIANTTAKLTERLKYDPLLLDFLTATEHKSLLQMCLKACLVSALSQPFIEQANGFSVSDRFEASFLPSVNKAVVVGFGGYMDYLIHHTQTPNILVIDSAIVKFKKRVEARQAYYRAHFPHTRVSFSDGCDVSELRRADLVSITGSALSNGTMGHLLSAAEGCDHIIVQGQSATIHPAELFDLGVRLVSTSAKPRGLHQLALTDYSAFVKCLEGNLPKLYMQAE